MSDETNTHRLLYSEDAQSILSDLQISLRILVWGPGETNKQKWFEKRTLVINALTEASNGLDTIITSEELFKQNPPPVEYGFAELAHAEKADVIIALVMASPTRQGGVYRELELIAPYRRLREKAWIFLPDAKQYLKRFQAGALDAFRDDHKVPLSWNVLQTCQRLRAICVDRVKEERKQRMYDKLMAKMHAKGPLFG